MGRSCRMLLRRVGSLRRAWRSAPLVLVGLVVFLFYQTSMVDRTGFKTLQQDLLNQSSMRESLFLPKHPERFISLLEAWHNKVPLSKRSCSGKAIVLTGQYVASSTEVQLYQRVLREQGYHVNQGRYAETSATFIHDGRGGHKWSHFICLKGAENSCLRKISFIHSQPYLRANIIPAFVGAFLDMGGVCRFLMDSRLSGVSLPIKLTACVAFSSEPEGLHHSENSWRLTVLPGSANQGLVALVNVYVLVTSATPLTAFLHRKGLVRTHPDKNSYVTELQTFFNKRLEHSLALQVFKHMKQVIGDVLTAALMTTADSSSSSRCPLCFHLMTFTLHYNSSVHPIVVKVQTDLHFDGMPYPNLGGQITKEYILEDMLKLLFPECSSEDSSPSALDAAGIKINDCKRPNSLCLSLDEIQFLLQFYQQLKRSGNFHLIYPRSYLYGPQHDVFQRFPAVRERERGPGLSALLEWLSLFYRQRMHMESEPVRMGDKWNSDPPEHDGCVEPYLRQLYTDPPLVLTPLFNPWVKEYRAEVPFDVLTIRVRPEPLSAKCHIHLDEHNGPRMANFPLGLGSSRINILLMDELGAEPVVMTIYSLHIFRESRPSLPMFDEYVLCGFIQDCGLVVRPDQPCGLESVSGLKTLPPCSSGDKPGRWVVPCLSCSDNRTCDWREVAWQPDSCYNPVFTQPQLQQCMMGRKVLFIGDSTNRGMMYYIMERVNTTLEDWDKAHSTIIYHNLNKGRTLISYSYYPQFWLHKSQRPNFQQALEQLIERSRPLENSPQTVLVAGGVQWFSLEHLRIMQRVLEREALQNIMVVVKSLGMGFHLPVDGIRSLSLAEVQELYGVNKNILENAKHLGYEVIDTFSITMGRYKEFLQGRCACHFHEVGKMEVPTQKRLQIYAGQSVSVPSMSPLPSIQPSSSYHVKGTVNQVYSEILLTRVCTPYIHNKSSSQTDLARSWS